MNNFEEYLGQQIDLRMEVYEEIKNEVYNQALRDFAGWLTQRLKSDDGDFYYYEEFIDEFLLSKAVKFLEDKYETN